MRRPPASSHRSRVYDPPYYAPGGFCLPVQSPAPDYDVIPDLSARTDTLPPRKSPSGLAVVLRAGYSLIATVIAVARKSRTERATVSRHAGPPLTRNGPLGGIARWEEIRRDRGIDYRAQSLPPAASLSTINLSDDTRRGCDVQAEI